MYTQIWNAAEGKVDDEHIRRDADGATIPRDPDNRDWRDYLEWRAAGNEPAPPPDGPPAPPAPE